MSHCFAIVGDRDSGKTTALGEVASALKRSGINVGGFLQQAVFENGEKTAYDLLSLESGDLLPFARKTPFLARNGLGFEFHPPAWDWAASQLLHSPNQVLIVDEMGHLEARGGGHLPPLQAAIRSRRVKVFILGIRKECLDPIRAELDVPIRVFAVAEKEALRKMVLESLFGQDPP